MRNTGEGFEEPQQWCGVAERDVRLDRAARRPTSTVTASTTSWPGADGPSPLVHGRLRTPVRRLGAPAHRRAARSRRGTIAPVETELFDQEYAVGDFDGDGTDDAAGRRQLLRGLLLLYEYDGTTLRPTGSQVQYGVAGDGVMDAVVAVDVNGDQLDDLVFTSVNIDDYSFYGVVGARPRTRRAGSTPRRSWADIPPCKGDYCEVDLRSTLSDGRPPTVHRHRVGAGSPQLRCRRRSASGRAPNVRSRRRNSPARDPSGALHVRPRPATPRRLPARRAGRRWPRRLRVCRLVDTHTDPYVPPADTIVHVEGDAANGFAIQHYDGSWHYPPTDSETMAECEEYDRRDPSVPLQGEQPHLVPRARRLQADDALLPLVQ